MTTLQTIRFRNASLIAIGTFLLVGSANFYLFGTSTIVAMINGGIFALFTFLGILGYYDQRGIHSKEMKVQFDNQQSQIVSLELDLKTAREEAAELSIDCAGLRFKLEMRGGQPQDLKHFMETRSNPNREVSFYPEEIHQLGEKSYLKLMAPNGNSVQFIYADTLIQPIDKNDYRKIMICIQGDRQWIAPRHKGKIQVNK